MSTPPNIVFCMCDELRWSELGCYGHPHIRTPHIDGLASEGVRFDVGISNAPICMPARSVVLSGQHARTCCGITTNSGWPGGASFGDAGFPQWPTGPRVHLPDTTLPELLRDAGYATAAVGKWHIEAWPDRIGFDHYVIPAHHHAHSAQWFCEDGGPLFSPDGYSVDYELARVGQYFQQRADDDGDQPFFLYYNISPPHMPLADAPERYTRMYGRDDVVVRGNVDLDRPIANQTQRFLTYLWDYRYYRDKLPYTLSLPREGFDIVDLTAMYMGLVTWVDDTVGGMLAALDAAGLAENTIVVFTADHGENIGSWGQMGKGMWRDESARVPMMARGPGVRTNAVTRQIGSLVDWAPTLLDLAGAAPPAHMHGQSLAPVLRGERETLDRNYAIIESAQQGVGIRTPTITCGIPWDGGSAQEPNRPIKSAISELFDMEADPYSLHNLVDDAGRRDEIASFAATIRTFDANTPWLAREGQRTSAST